LGSGEAPVPTGVRCAVADLQHAAMRLVASPCPMRIGAAAHGRARVDGRNGEHGALQRVH
jgi:hypothetical protein